MTRTSTLIFHTQLPRHQVGHTRLARQSESWFASVILQKVALLLQFILIVQLSFAVEVNSEVPTVRRGSTLAKEELVTADKTQLFSIPRQSQTFTVIRSNGRAVNFSVISLNGYTYADFSALVRSAFPESMCRQTESETRNGTLRVYPDCAFIQLIEDSNSLIVQLPVESIQEKNRLLVPVEGFFNALEAIGLFHVEFDQNSVYLSAFSEDFVRVGWVSNSQTPTDVIEPRAGEDLTTSLSLLNTVSEKDDAGNKHRSFPRFEEFGAMGTHPVEEIVIDADGEYESVFTAIEKGELSERFNLTISHPHSVAPLFGPEAIQAETEMAFPTLANPSVDTALGDDDSSPIVEERTRSSQITKLSDTVNASKSYVLPSNLKRREVENFKFKRLKVDSISSMVISSIDAPSTGSDVSESDMIKFSDVLQPEIASVGKLFVKQIRMLNVGTSEANNEVRIELIADGPIPSSSTPTLNEREVSIRFPSIADNISGVSLQEPIVRLLHTEESGSLVVKASFAVKPLAVRLERKSLESLVIVATMGDAIVDAPLPDKTELDGNFISKFEPAVEPAPVLSPEMVAEYAQTEKSKKKWKLDCIVIDAGHGGKDEGATSITGQKEKTITLAIAKKLRTLLQKRLPDTKIVMTREDDSFVELYRRGQMANEQKGKLFISLHCNSMPTTPHTANGFEAYILRPGKNADAVRVAKEENAVIKFEKDQKRYKKMTEEELIIATMAQSSFLKLSERFATIVCRELSTRTTIQKRGVNQAGFFVLVGASMPSILFETGFLSNEADEKVLTSSKGQSKIAAGLAKSIEEYAAEYEEQFEK